MNTPATNVITTGLAEARPFLPSSSPQPYVVNNPATGCQLILRAIGATTLVAIQPDSGVVNAAWLDTETLTSAAGWATQRNAAQRNAAGANLYFTLNEPVSGLCKKPAKADIRTLRGIGADIDAKAGRDLDTAWAAIGAVPCAPSLIIMSGGGWQPFWLFDVPIAATPDTVSQVEAVGRKIVALTGSDAVQNIDRIFRLPFTINYPNKKKRKQGRTACLAGIVLTPASQS
jgi:hypothetical protein